MRIAIAILALCIVTSACRKEMPQTVIAEKPVARLIIAYLCGDNNLSSEVNEKINALYKGMRMAGDVDGRLVVYADPSNAMPQLSEITRDGIVPIEMISEINSASHVNLKKTLQRIIAEFPADSYGLICFSHASGWLPQNALDNPTEFNPSTDADNGIAPENSKTRTIFNDQGSEMTIRDFAAALDILPKHRKFNFMIFETCYMAGIEVAYELKDRTQYIIASAAEMVSNGFVNTYAENLGLLFDKQPKLDIFARNHFNIWNAKTGPWRSATVSLINTEHIEQLALSMKEITQGNPDWTTDIDIASIQHFNRNPHRLFFDLGQTVEKIATVEQLSAFDEALAKVVEYSAATPYIMQGQSYSFAIARHSGLTTYIAQKAYPNLNQAYTQTEWYNSIK